MIPIQIKIIIIIGIFVCLFATLLGIARDQPWLVIVNIALIGNLSFQYIYWRHSSVWDKRKF